MHDADRRKQDLTKKTINFKRLVTAAVLVPLIILYILYLPPFPYFLGLLLVIAMLSMVEFFIMYNVPKRLYLPAVLFGGALFYIICLYPHRITEALFAALSILLLLKLISAGSPSGSMKEIGPISVGFIYIVSFLSFQWLLRDDLMGREHILLLYSSVWLADSAAYYVGTYLGRNKLFPAVSPNKTREGVYGSILGGTVGAVIATSIFNITDITILKAVVIGAILGIVAVLGDLIESMFKRDAGVKDSSSIIPGHGGLLDKLDGVLLAGPVLYLILRSF